MPETTSARGDGEDRPAPDLDEAHTGLGAASHEARFAVTELRQARDRIDRFRAMANKNPRIFKPELAAALHQLAEKLIWAGRHRAAIGPLGEAIERLRRLASADPDAYLAELARALADRGRAAIALDDAETAIEHLAEAVSYLRSLASRAPLVHAQDLVMTLADHARALAEVGDREAAADTFSEADHWHRQAGDPEAGLASTLTEPALSLYRSLDPAGTRGQRQLG